MTDRESILRRLAHNAIVRNVVLAVCAIVIFVGLWALILSIFTRHGQHAPVPDFIGVQIVDAEGMARAAGLEIEVTDSIYAPTYVGGSVVEQDPVAGMEVKRGRRVFVAITSHQQKMVAVPHVAGYSLRQAKNMIEMAGLEIKELRYATNIATNNVLAQIVGRDTVRRDSKMRAPAGSGVVLIVGRASENATVVIPKVVGLTLREAKGRLWERGMNIGAIERDAGINLINQRDARVFRQRPAYGSSAKLGERVALFLTLDPSKIAEGITDADRDARHAIRKREEAAAEEKLRRESEKIEIEADTVTQ